jgi:hypothetical protein
MTKRKTATSSPTSGKTAASPPTPRKTAAPSGAKRKPPHPRSVPIPELEADVDSAPDQPFEEGSRDALGAELRHRMISEAAYYRYAERGYCDGYEVDDWLAAEAEIDHLLLNPESGAETVMLPARRIPQPPVQCCASLRS